MISQEISHQLPTASCLTSLLGRVDDPRWRKKVVKQFYSLWVHVISAHLPHLLESMRSLYWPTEECFECAMSLVRSGITAVGFTGVQHSAGGEQISAAHRYLKLVLVDFYMWAHPTFGGLKKTPHVHSRKRKRKNEISRVTDDPSFTHELTSLQHQGEQQPGVPGGPDVQLGDNLPPGSNGDVHRPYDWDAPDANSTDGD